MWSAANLLAVIPTREEAGFAYLYCFLISGPPKTKLIGCQLKYQDFIGQIDELAFHWMFEDYKTPPDVFTSARPKGTLRLKAIQI